MRLRDAMHERQWIEHVNSVDCNRPWSQLFYCQRV